MVFALGCAVVMGLCAIGPATPDIGFGGVPVLGAKDTLRQLQKPYDLVKLNVLGANYCENLLDMRLNVTSYSHMNLDSPVGDAWNLQFPDDSARFLEAVAWEDENSPIVRLELARRLTKGLLAAYVPGAYSQHYFRHRNGGKTFLIFGDKQAPGRLLLSMWGDEISGSLKVGFRVRREGKWVDMNAFTHSDPEGSPIDAGAARSGRWWNTSPVPVTREYRSAGGNVTFSGSYGFSDEDRPLEFGFRSGSGEPIQVVVGEPACPMPLLGDYRIPTVVHLPDRKTTYRSDTDGDHTFERPAFHYLVLRKPGAWASPGYSTALVVSWEGAPDRVEVIADKGYGEVRVCYPGPAGKVHLQPYHWVEGNDLEILHRAGECMAAGKPIPQQGFPTQQMENALPAGLAAGAYLLTRYADPMATTARINAARRVDRLIAAEAEGKTFARIFFEVKAAAWMARACRAAGDAAGVARYSAFVDQSMKRMCAPQTGYDGKAWPDGWTHFCCAKACRLAYDATGNPEYLAAFERAANVYTIDDKGIYRYGKRLDAPGGFDTYSGSLAMGVWGCADMADRVQQLIDLKAPNGWYEPTRPVCDTWNDAGAGPWSQDDANPEYVGISLRAAKLPTSRKTIVPVGAFPSYDRTGKVVLDGRPLVRNPYFLPGVGKARTIPASQIGKGPAVTSLELVPGTAAERSALVAERGGVVDGRRTVTGAEAPLVYRFEVGKAAGLALDLRMQGDGYRVEVSPDGYRWIERMDTWDPVQADHSTDLSFLVGSREELVRLDVMDQPELIQRLGEGAHRTYPYDMSLVSTCYLEVMAANGYKLSLSPNGKAWREVARDTDIDGGAGKAGEDAAVLRMLDATPFIGKEGHLYFRIADRKEAAADYGHRTGLLRRTTVYAAFKSPRVFVRISNVRADAGHSFTVERVSLREW